MAKKTKLTKAAVKIGTVMGRLTELLTRSRKQE